ncbi:predicted protein [Sclerotinia sclerotiorum 1980 UF-70]|uniref:Uncharacterized protein n=1 Tax=Sclerotinia sclerotiorum (strain ATCC 18683 / 1980 / Ss-1) TaxID=665079 RepID=A7ETW3_SCLS1|nr:predicted protein [Sclerotinia sclerotiorum 1980 UF-70]EDN92905.1 predicted protein [Sclerotinia sclerotiorum 1980 UF-70]
MIDPLNGPIVSSKFNLLRSGGQKLSWLDYLELFNALLVASNIRIQVKQSCWRINNKRSSCDKFNGLWHTTQDVKRTT